MSFTQYSSRLPALFPRDAGTASGPHEDDIGTVRPGRGSPNEKVVEGDITTKQPERDSSSEQTEVWDSPQGSGATLLTKETKPHLRVLHDPCTCVTLASELRLNPRKEAPVPQAYMRTTMLFRTRGRLEINCFITIACFDEGLMLCQR